MSSLGLSDRWVGAGDLKVGDTLKEADGTIGTVTGVQTVTQSKQMYNLSVGVAHTYFVGQMGWLVHNQRQPLLPTPPILMTETNAGTYRDLKHAGVEYDNITPHHMPSTGYMKRNALDPWSLNEGWAMNMYDPGPKYIGRHTRTTTFSTRLTRIPHYANLSPRDALAYDVREVRRIYMEDGLYGPEVRKRLQEVIKGNKTDFPLTFAKPPVVCP